MALRYSGSVTVDVRWLDDEGQYLCRLSRVALGVRTRAAIYVSAPDVGRVAVGSPEAYDAAAKTAIELCDALDEGDWGDASAWGASGIAIARKGTTKAVGARDHKPTGRSPQIVGKAGAKCA